jgi:hypothetical protein
LTYGKWISLRCMATQEYCVPFNYQIKGITRMSDLYVRKITRLWLNLYGYGKITMRVIDVIRHWVIAA